MKIIKIFVTCLILLSVSIFSCAKKPVKALIVTGQNNHNWEVNSVVLQKYLNESGIFTADLAISPKRGEDMSSFRPDFSAYKVVVLDYNGDAWCDDTNKAFLEYVKKGGGVVVYHAADNPFRNWKEYNEIIGLGGWENRDETDGPYVYFKDGKEVRDTSPGPGGSHGSQHEYTIVVRDKKHPITKDLPESWMHSKDELYDRLRGPAKNLTVLATAYSAKETGGTGRDEPVLMTIKWGKGRIFHTVLGDGIRSTVEGGSFAVTFLRGAEWAATGKVTQKIPDGFPRK
jgi:type 1 glutamine amidotransferase